jgi:hypothetical protein
MGFFSHLADVATGKNEKRNKLLVNNLNFFTNRLYPKGERRSHSSYACIWSDACIHTSYYFLDELFFGNQEDEFIAKPFRSKLPLIGPGNVLELFKILAIYTLVRNYSCADGREEMFNAVGTTFKDFQIKVFEYFDFHEEHKRIHQDFMNDEDLEINKFSRLILNLFEQKGFGGKPTRDHLTIQAFIAYLHHFYMKPFDDILEKLYIEYS